MHLIYSYKFHPMVIHPRVVHFSCIDPTTHLYDVVFIQGFFHIIYPFSYLSHMVFNPRGCILVLLFRMRASRDAVINLAAYSFC